MDGNSGAELPAALRQRTGFAVIRLAAEFRRRLTDDLAALGVSQHQHAILCCLAEFGPAFQKDVAARLGIDTGDTVALVEGLERTGLITRVRDPRDRRRQILEITELGAAALVRIEEAIDAVEREELITLSDHDRTALHTAAVLALTHHAPLAWPTDDVQSAGATLPQPSTAPIDVTPLNAAPPLNTDPPNTDPPSTVPTHSAPLTTPPLNAGQLPDLLRLLAALPRAALGAGRSLLAPLIRWPN
jgi:DNA-binding MarR family transcriptional regulator